MPDLARALEALSTHMGDTHRATEEALARACLGAFPACHGFLARSGTDVAGAALVSPVFSTTRGAPGAYVSDLWVADEFRGRGLGRRLLCVAGEFAARNWRARFLKLTVYAENAGARAFYERLGFEVAERDRACLLGDAGFDDLMGEAG